MTPGIEKRKQSLYIPQDVLEEVMSEAKRQDRSLSWIMQQAWKVARDTIKSYPTYSTKKVE